MIEQKHRVRYLASGRNDEACCSECNACNEHGDGRIDLDIGTSIFCHIRVDLMSLAKVNWIS
ncbi:MAG: hypothetical protein II860_03055 [Prevotella sp.]|nr:hypothetical protein [Prevotella sp.]